MHPPGHNIGLRMPENVIGIDVDHYDDKNGAATLSAAIEKWGTSPTPGAVSARDWPSGILFYRVPAGLHWNDLGPAVELIKPVHRYAVVWPSTNPKADGAPYRWYAPRSDDDQPADRIPRCRAPVAARPVDRRTHRRPPPGRRSRLRRRRRLPKPTSGYRARRSRHLPPRPGAARTILTASTPAPPTTASTN